MINWAAIMLSKESDSGKNTRSMASDVFILRCLLLSGGFGFAAQERGQRPEIAMAVGAEEVRLGEQPS